MAKKMGFLAKLPAVETSGAVVTYLSLPEEAAETLHDAVQLEAEQISPFDEGDYSVAYEPLGKQHGMIHGLVVISSHETLNATWYDWMKERGVLAQKRLDLTALGWWRAIYERCPTLTKGEHLVLLCAPNEHLLFLVAKGHPVSLRALPAEATPADLIREGTVLLSQAAMNGFGGELASVVCFADAPEKGAPLEALTEGAVQFELLKDEDAGAFLQRGLKLREDEKSPFDLTPEPWREEARAARKRRVMLFGAVLLGLAWVACAAMLYVKPQMVKRQLDTLKVQLKAQQAAYQEVLALQSRVQLIERYQDRSYSALEILRLICLAKPDAMTFKSFTYRQAETRQDLEEGQKRSETLRVTGTTKNPSDTYAFTEKLREDELGRIQDVKTPVLRQNTKTREQEFTVDMYFEKQEVSE